MTDCGANISFRSPSLSFFLRDDVDDSTVGLQSELRFLGSSKPAAGFTSTRSFVIFVFLFVLLLTSLVSVFAWF